MIAQGLWAVLLKIIWGSSILRHSTLVSLLWFVVQDPYALPVNPINADFGLLKGVVWELNQA